MSDDIASFMALIYLLCISLHKQSLHRLSPHLPHPCRNTICPSTSLFCGPNSGFWQSGTAQKLQLNVVSPTAAWMPNGDGVGPPMKRRANVLWSGQVKRAKVRSVSGTANESARVLEVARRLQKLVTLRNGKTWTYRTSTGTTRRRWSSILEEVVEWGLGLCVGNRVLQNGVIFLLFFSSFAHHVEE